MPGAIVDEVVEAARKTWSQDYDKWVEAMNLSLPLELPYIKVVRSMHILAVLEAFRAELQGDSKPRYRLWWNTFMSNIVEESLTFRMHISSRTNAERRRSFEDNPTINR